MSGLNPKIEVRLAYVNHGQASACEVANKHNLPYQYCKRCEADTPVIENECLLCGSNTEPVVEVEPVKPGDKVYARLTSIALECWQNGNSPLPFHQWMERKGLVMQDGFFKAIEEPVTPSIFAS